MKKALSSARGLTFIELLVTASLVSIMLVGSMNLLARVYRGISVTIQKNRSVNLASEKLDFYRKFSFTGLQVTDEQYQPMPYYNLKNGPKTYYESVTIGTATFDVYSWVQWAEEINGSIEGKKTSELDNDYDYNIKKISVAVVYTSGGVEKVSKMSTFMTNKDLPLAGSIVSGKILRRNASGTVVKGAGMYSGAHILFQDFPQYMTRIYDDDGNFKVLDVAPGSYNLTARGSGLVTTDYSSNPLTITSIPATYSNIIITCQEVPAGNVSGNVYWGVADETSTPTPTPVAYCPNTKILYATGAMAGKSQQWQYFNRISVYDGSSDNFCSACNANTYNNTTNQKGYSEFSDAPINPNSGICEVVLKIKVNCWACEADVSFNFTNDSGAHWANAGVNNWTGSASTNLVSYRIPDVYLDVEIAIPITFLYDQWDWQKVNSLGMVVNGGYNFWVLPGFGNVEHITLDYVRIDVSYYDGAPPPTYTPTPINSPTPLPYPCAYDAVVAAMDSVSQPFKTSSSDCKYGLTGIDVSTSNYTSIIAFKERDSSGVSYFKQIDNVTVTAGTTTNLDIFLEPASNTPAVFGVVRDAVTNNPVPGAAVMMDDPAGSNTVTAGGGTYFLMPVTEGTYTLKASLSGYKTLNPVTKNWYKGISKAEDIMLQPIGHISGNITDETTGNPVPGIDIQAKDAAGNIIGNGRSDSTGFYLIKEIYAGQTYKLEPLIDPDVMDVTYPFKKYWSGVTVNLGITTPNKDFKIRQNYGTISGKVMVDGTDVGSGTTVIAYPSSMPTPAHAHDFKVDNSNPNSKKHGGRAREDSPYYGTITNNGAEFRISVPMGDTYSLYAYYSFVSYTGKSSKPNKQLKNFYKIRSGVLVNQLEIVGQDIYGSLGSWTAY